jgi:pimeloyl-ACP methyl ester carboxylesterase
MGILVWTLASLGAATAGSVLWTRLEARAAEREVPMLGRNVRVNGATLHIAEAGKGKGPPIVLIHGLGGQLRNLSWPLFPLLSEDHHVIAVDRPGSGYSTREPDLPSGMRGDAAAIAELIQTLDLGRPLLVGHSLGGAVSLTMAVHHPEVVGGLALLAPLTHLVGEAPRVFQSLEVHSSALRGILSHTVAVPGVRLLQDRVLREVFAPEPVHPDYGGAGGGFLSRRPESFRIASHDLLSVPNHLAEVEAGYSRIGVPTAVLYGRGDRILDPTVHGVPMRDRIPGCTVELVEGGHMIPVTQPEVVADFIRRVAARLPQDQAS